MMRVWAIINRSSFSSQMQSQKGNLTQWVDEILTGVWRYQVRRRVAWHQWFTRLKRRAPRPQQSNGTLLNYVDQPDSFADSASTALLAATTFRYSLLTYDGKHDAAAMQALSLVWQSIDQNGWLLNVVDPFSFTQQLRGGAHSPEAQSFVLLLAAAWGAF
jgi:rhamnogalacturonyl hydrolase YesR